MNEKWLVLSNCHTFGLAHSLTLMNPDIDVDAIDVGTFKQDVSKYIKKIPCYSRVIIHPEFKTINGADFSGAVRLSCMPSINFNAYHPDITGSVSVSVNAPGQPMEMRALRGPMHDYHSLIVLAAHELGYDLNKTISCFRNDVYIQAGYYNRWALEREALLVHFSKFGPDLSESIRAWAREGVFMYSINHPKIRCIFDIARLFLKSLGFDTISSDYLPHDNIANGPWWPVYPEIGDRYSVRGSYVFKPANQYRFLSLEDFVRQSLELYAGFSPGAIRTPNPRYQQVKAAIGG